MKTYFFTNNINSLIKIGKSLSPRSRSTRVAGECSFIKINILHLIDGDYEKYFHKRYSENRKCGEWYDIPGLTPEIIESELQKMPVYRNNLPKTVAEAPVLPAAKPVEAKKAVSKAPKVTVAPVNEAAQSFLNKRREGKLK